MHVGASASGVSLGVDLSRVVDYSSDEATDGLEIKAGVYYIKTNW
jgi:hypothetical protein